MPPMDPIVAGTLLAFTGWAAAGDVRTRRIPNVLTFGMMAAGLAAGLVRGGGTGLGAAVLGLIAGAALLLPVYLLGGMGAGDLKLLAGIGAFVGAREVLVMFLVIAVIGGLMGLVLMVVRDRGFSTFNAIALGWWLTLTTRRNHAVLQPAAGAASGETNHGARYKLPYAVPIALGTIAVCAVRLAGT